MLDMSAMQGPEILLYGYYQIERILFYAIAIAGLVGAVMAGTTRDDAYTAGDRQSKWIWTGLLAGSALMVALRVPFLSWAGMVVIGLYWFDVRPQLRAIISNSGGW